MPSIPVPATAECMSKFDKHAIMQRAWELFRKQHINCRPATEAARRKAFGNCLRSAWMGAKYDIAQAAKTLQERAADKVQALTLELMRVDAKGFKHHIRDERRALVVEIAALQGRMA